MDPGGGFSGYGVTSKGDKKVEGWRGFFGGIIAARFDMDGK